MSLLDGQVAVVTGAGRGIGAAVATLFARNGASVVVNDLGANVDGTGADPTVAQTMVDQLNGNGHSASASHHDVRVSAEASALMRLAVENFGHLDVLVNAAGLCNDHALVNLDPRDWQAALDTQLTGTFNCVRAAASIMRAQNRGRIVNTTGNAGLIGSHGQASTSAAAAGVYGLTRTAAIELQRHGINVNAVAPLAKTRQTEDHPMFQKSATLTTSHVAPVYLYLASTLSGDITGQVIAVAGGRLSIYRMTESHSRYKDEQSGEWTAEEIADQLRDVPRS